MGTEDDIAALLPNAPPPGPGRRAAAIEQAMRTFDAAHDARARPAREPRPQRSSPWWSSLGQPYAGALAAAASLALIALPVAWISFGDRSGEPPSETVESGAANATLDEAFAEPSRPPSPQAPSTPATAAAPQNGVAQERASPPPDSRTAIAAVPPPPPTAFAEAAPVVALTRPAEPSAPTGERARNSRQEDSIMVTGSRIAAPNLESAPSALDVGSDVAAAVPTIARKSTASGDARGDWNACTVADPNRTLAGCREHIDPSAKGSAGRAAAHLADGLSLAWRGELARAITAFDRAIAIAPQSSFAFLNRGLAYRRSGDRDRALADLDRAVRLAPRSARAYYQRSLLLRQLGDSRRARADADRAVDLDPRYAAVAR
jgi:hypothetical protein